MDNRIIQNTVLDYSMCRIPRIDISDAKIKGAKQLNLYVVTSTFRVYFSLPNVPVNTWKKKSREVSDFFAKTKDRYTLFLVVTNSANDDNVLYCNKIS